MGEKSPKNTNKLKKQQQAQKKNLKPKSAPPGPVNVRVKK